MDSPTTHTDSISEADTRDAATFSDLLVANRAYVQFTLSGGMPDLADAASKRDMTEEQIFVCELVSHSADRLRVELFLKAKEQGVSERELSVLLLEPIADLMRSAALGEN